MSTLLPAVVRETAPHPRFSVIWLHGLGADGNDFAPIVAELGLPATPGVRFIFPHAPAIPVTCNNGFVMPAWYDIKVLDGLRRDVDEAGIVASRASIRELIAAENARGIPCSRILLAGFSQGGALAYVTALTHDAPLGGIIALSTYLPVPDLLAREATTDNRAIPIFAAHGTEDPVVPLQLGEHARDLLQEQAYRVEWHTYRMPHSVCLEEVAAIGAWLRGRLSAADGE